MSARHRIYLDSSVLVNYSFKKGNEQFSLLAMTLLNKVQIGLYEGVISTLCLMELMTSLRGLLTSHGVRDPQKWRSAIEEAFQAIFRVKNIVLVEGNPNERIGTDEIRDLFYSSIVWEAFEILTKHPGKAGLDKENKLKHDGLSAPDVIHIALAKRLACSEIASFDEDFLESKGEIYALILHKNSGW